MFNFALSKMPKFEDPFSLMNILTILMIIMAVVAIITIVIAPEDNHAIIIDHGLIHQESGKILLVFVNQSNLEQEINKIEIKSESTTFHPIPTLSRTVINDTIVLTTDVIIEPNQIYSFESDINIKEGKKYIVSIESDNRVISKTIYSR